MFYSKSTGGFYPESLKARYQAKGAWPADAVALSDTERDTYWRKNPPNGYELGATAEGRPAWIEKPQPPADDRRTAAKTTIDTAAGSARARYVSAGNLIEEEYRLALQQTQQWRAAGSPADSVPQAIQDWATASGITAEEAAVSIEQTAAAWETVLLTIRKLRLDGKVAVDNAPDDADFVAIAQPYIDQLNAMQP